MLAFCHLLLTLTFVFLVAWTKLDSYLVSLFFAFGHSSLWFVIWCFFVLFTLLVHTGFLAVTWAAINPVLCSISMYGGKKNKTKPCSQLYPWIRPCASRGSCEKQEGNKTTNSGCLIHTPCDMCVLSEWRQNHTHSLHYSFSSSHYFFHWAKAQ